MKHQKPLIHEYTNFLRSIDDVEEASKLYARCGCGCRSLQRPTPTYRLPRVSRGAPASVD